MQVQQQFYVIHALFLIRINLIRISRLKNLKNLRILHEYAEMAEMSKTKKEILQLSGKFHKYVTKTLHFTLCFNYNAFISIEVIGGVPGILGQIFSFNIGFCRFLRNCKSLPCCRDTLNVLIFSRTYFRALRLREN